MGAAHVMTYTVRRGGRTLSCCCLWGRHGRPRRRRWPGYRWSWPRTWSCWWLSSGWPSNRPPPSPPHYLKQRHVFVHGHWTDLLNSIHMAQGMEMWWPFYWNVVNHRMEMWWLIDLTCSGFWNGDVVAHWPNMYLYCSGFWNEDVVTHWTDCCV